MTVSAFQQSRIARPDRYAWPSSCAALASRLLAVLLAMTTHQGWAAQCGLSIQGLSFGVYDTFLNVALDSVGNIQVTCDVSVPYSVAISPGGGSYALRAMASDAKRLNYNLYTNVTRTVVWGDGSGNTAMITSSANPANHTVYGRIPQMQNAFVESYSDVITVTLTF